MCIEMDGWNFETFLKRNESGSNLNTHTKEEEEEKKILVNI